MGKTPSDWGDTVIGSILQECQKCGGCNLLEDADQKDYIQDLHPEGRRQEGEILLLERSSETAQKV